MNKRYQILSIVVVVVLMSAMVYAAPATKVAAGNALSAEANTITVPIEVSNSTGLMAMDIPLKFSEGVRLKEVDFENTRVSYFDFKIADINNDENTVIIGLINQLSSARVDALNDGTGPVANLVFEIEDPAVNQITIEATETTKPRHAMIFVFQQPDGQSVENPKFDNVTVSLSGINNPSVPDKFELMQNYPNPFNPETNLSFTVPVATNYTLTIFNVLGQTVDQFNGYSEAGRVDISWNASNRSSGVYFYKLDTDSFTETKKMILLK
ncbi:MAG: T9SS type A sorting domain-containing protein [candidate division Zixibacteria bacterium]|nr:T9SS type A sorting domain-containing protein [candidate division Zixibacteria bacterium]